MLALQCNNLQRLAIENEEGFDPFQVFEVRHRACSLLYVTVKCGRNISKGSSTKDLMDTPDPYVRLRLPNSPDGRRKTMHYDNEINPKWEESFRFYLDTDKNNTLYLDLMDANVISDEVIDTQEFKLNNLEPGRAEHITFKFKESSEVDVDLKLV
ncbi:unnamed protein product [Owenia fusiformis]|uniref:C2 domain-containing protein n=1 Tax=Owenia fusiformis TaxID=6347 RepID=A0A8S4P0I9_OWEFU|nr:unnamed protein product [Owenia fusiformis]